MEYYSERRTLFENHLNVRRANIDIAPISEWWHRPISESSLSLSTVCTGTIVDGLLGEGLESAITGLYWGKELDCTNAAFLGQAVLIAKAEPACLIDYPPIWIAWMDETNRAISVWSAWARQEEFQSLDAEVQAAFWRRGAEQIRGGYPGLASTFWDRQRSALRKLVLAGGEEIDVARDCIGYLKCSADLLRLAPPCIGTTSLFDPVFVRELEKHVGDRPVLTVMFREFWRTVSDWLEGPVASATDASFWRTTAKVLETVRASGLIQNRSDRSKLTRLVNSASAGTLVGVTEIRALAKFHAIVAERLRSEWEDTKPNSLF